MKIVEIKALPNGAHRNQSGQFQTVPSGWALIPDGMTLDSFPFGEVKAKKVNGVMTVTSWTPGVMPEPTPEPVPSSPEELTTADMAAAIKEGVNAI